MILLFSACVLPALKYKVTSVRVLPEPAFCAEDKEGKAGPSPRPRRGAARTPRVENAAGWRARETDDPAGEATSQVPVRRTWGGGEPGTGRARG